MVTVGAVESTEKEATAQVSGKDPGMSETDEGTEGSPTILAKNE